MTLVQRQMLSLIRSALHGTEPEADLFAGTPDWQAIYDLSVEQAVSSLVTDGIDRRPADRKPPIAQLEPFLADTLATEMRNDAINRFARGLFHRLEKASVTALMVKGQALARLYPLPLHRQPGDIDVLLMPADYPVARNTLLPKATSVEVEHPEILHQGMTFGSIEVELHGTISTLMSVRLDRRLSALMEDMFRREDFRSENFGGVAVRTPSLLFDAIYILTHFLHHYWSSGVGIRQLIDWGLFLCAHSDKIDKPQLESHLREMGLFRIWQTFAGLVADRFGFPAERLPFHSDRYRRKYEGILRYIFKSGNFGKNQPRADKPQNYVRRKIYSFWHLVVCDRLRHFPEFPAESLRYFFGASHYGLIRLSQGE